MNCNRRRDSFNWFSNAGRRLFPWLSASFYGILGEILGKFSWREVEDNGGLAIFVPCPGHGRTDGQTDNENEECPAEPDMKTSLRNGNGYDGVRFDLTVPCYLEPAAFSSESSESATNLADRRTSLLVQDSSLENFYRNLSAPSTRSTASTTDTPQLSNKFILEILDSWKELFSSSRQSPSTREERVFSFLRIEFARRHSKFRVERNMEEKPRIYIYTYILFFANYASSKIDNERWNSISTRRCLVIRP